MSIRLQEQTEYLAYMSGETKALPLPKQMLLMVTSHGHQQCAHCYCASEYNPELPEKVIGKSVLDRIIVNILPYMDSVLLSGGREGLTTDGPIPYILAYAQDVKTPVSLCADYTLVEGLLLRDIVQYSVKGLYLSIPGELLDHLGNNHAAPALCILLDKMRTLKKYFRSAFPQLCLICPITPHSFTNLDLLIPWLIEHNIGKLIGQYEEFENPSPRTGTNSPGAKTELDWLAPIYAEFKKTDITFHVLSTKSANHSAKTLTSPNPFGHCTEPWNQLVVSAFGDVKFCRYHPLSLGNVYWQSLYDIWYGTMAIQYRSLLLRNQVPPGCEHCAHFSEFSSSEAPQSITGTELNSVNAVNFVSFQDNPRIRLSGWKSTLFMDRATNDSLLIELCKMTLPEAPSKGRIVVNGTPCTRFFLIDDVWQTVEAPLDSIKENFLKIDIIVDESQQREFSAPGLHGREVGFLFNEIKGIAWQKRAEFSNALVFLGGEIKMTYKITGQNLAIRMYWRSLKERLRDVTVSIRFLHEKLISDLANPLKRFLTRQKDRLFTGQRNLLQNIESGIWREHSLIIDDFEVIVPRDLDQGVYVMEISLIDESSEGKNVEILQSDWQADAGKMYWESFIVGGQNE